MTLNQIKKKYMPKNTNLPVEHKLLTLKEKQIKQQTINLNNSLKNTLNQSKLPKKILQIQKKLQKFKYQKTHQQLINLQTRKKQIEQINDAVQQHRHFQITKIRMNHQKTKQLEKRVLQVFKSTQNDKKVRNQKQQNFFRFMKSKKDNHQNQLRKQQEKTFKNGLQEFELNCMRQGIELQHDPTKQYVQKKENFNAVVMMQRIKDNIKNLQRQRKQRKKRQNIKAIQSLQISEKSQKLSQQNNLLERLEKNMKKHYSFCQNLRAQMLQGKAIQTEIANKLKNRQIKPLPQVTEQQKQQFQAKIRANRLIYYDKQIQRLQKKDKKLRLIAEQVLEALLYTSIVSEQSQKSLTFTYTQWKDLQKVFLNFNHTLQSKWKKIEINSKILDPEKVEIFKNYVSDIKQILKNSQNTQNQQKQLAQLINGLIDIIYPTKQLSQKTNLPLYMPLRIGFTGNRLCGKTTQIKKLISKFNNLVLIDPKKILNQALQLAKPPPVNQDPKKKKDSKKPQEQTPQRIQLKKFGQSILQEIKKQYGQQYVQVEKLSIEYYIKALKYKLQKSFQPKSKKQIYDIYQKKKEEQTQRIKNFAINQQQKNKKKDSKKGAVVAQVQSPTFNQLFYIQGFILDNINLNVQNLKIIQKQLNGFISFDQRVNEQAEKLKEQLSLFIPISKTQKPTELNKGFFNILIDLEQTEQSFIQRNQGRKIDPQTGQIYHPKFNPVPTDIKGLAERLIQLKPQQNQSIQEKQIISKNRQIYYSQFGYQKQKILVFKKIEEKSIQETTACVNKILQDTLKIQYEQIKQWENQKQETQQYRQEQNKEVNPNPNTNTNNENQQNENNNKTKQQQQTKQTTILFTQELFKSLKDPILLNRFKQLTTKYQSKLIGYLQKISINHGNFELQYLAQQKKFMQIINRPDDKAGKILTFQDNYNKLLEQKANILNDKSAISHLIQKLDQLYDSLWINLDKKKNQAINHRKVFESSTWLNDQAQIIVQNFKQILQNQLNYLVDLLSFVLYTQLKIDGKQTQPIIDYLCLGIPKQQQIIQSIQISCEQPSSISPRLTYYFNQIQNCLKTIQSWFKKKQSQSKITLNKQLQQFSRILINKQKAYIFAVLKKLNQKNYSLISEELCYYKVLVNKMDDWIIQGIKSQNEFIYKIYKQIKSHIQKLAKIYLKDLFPPQITLTLLPILHLPPIQYIPLINKSIQFNIQSYKIFLQEIKYLCFFKNQSLRINFNMFKEYFNKRKKSKLLNQIYLNIDFDIMQQYLVIEGDVNFKEICIAMLFWKRKVLDDEQLNKYLTNMNKRKNQNQNQENQNNQQMKTIQKAEDMNLQPLLKDSDLRSNEILAMKHFIFQIFRSQFTNQMEIKDFIQVLRVFSSLQLFKYGDSIMTGKE